MTFNDLNFKPHNNWADGVRAVIFFDNGFGASVIRSEHSYGGEDGLYELAVIKGNWEDWSICYDTDVTDDVLGYLSESDVSNLLQKIEELSDDRG